MTLTGMGNGVNPGSVSKSVSIRHAEGPFLDRKGPLTW